MRLKQRTKQFPEYCDFKILLPRNLSLRSFSLQNSFLRYFSFRTSLEPYQYFRLRLLLLVPILDLDCDLDLALPRGRTNERSDILPRRPPARLLFFKPPADSLASWRGSGTTSSQKIAFSICYYSSFFVHDNQVVFYP